VQNSLEYSFADNATKSRLKADLASALTAFERRMQQNPERRTAAAEPRTP